MGHTTLISRALHPKLCVGFILAIQLFGSNLFADDEITTFFIVRHAERGDAAAESGLSDVGVQRSIELRELLQNIEINDVYSTSFERTKKTVQPIADAANLQIKSIPQAQQITAWIENLAQRHHGQNVIIAAHSGNADNIVSPTPSAAGIAQRLARQSVPAITGDEYDKLLIVEIRTIDGNTTRLFRTMRYGPLEKLGQISLTGELFESEDISAVISVGDHLIVASDEADSIQFLKSTGTNQFESQNAHSLSNGGELDIEGLAKVDDTFFVLGSHSMVRRKVDLNKPDTYTRKYSKNRKRFLTEKIKSESNRDRIYSLKFDVSTNNSPTNVTRTLELNSFFETHPVLGIYNGLPSKENGIDIEGIATDGTHLYLGFRSPVFRLGYAPILKIDLDSTDDANLLFVNLGGAGIRDLRKTEEGFLIVAGPSGDAAGTYHLFFWDGNDCIPGTRGDDEPKMGSVSLLGRIPTPPGSKAEGIAVLNEDDESFEILIAYDGIKNGGMTRFRAKRP